MAGFDLGSLIQTASVSANRIGLEGRQTHSASLDGDSAPRLKGTVKSESAPSFKDMLAQALDTVNDLQVNADRMAQKVATGEINDIHEVLMAVEEVNLGLQLTMQIRNKIIEAYQEVMRMQI